MKYEKVGGGVSEAGVKGKGLIGAVNATPDLEYSPTRFSKKLVLPWRLMVSIHSNGFPTLKCRSQPRQRRSPSEVASCSYYIKNVPIHIGNIFKGLPF